MFVPVFHILKQFPHTNFLNLPVMNRYQQQDTSESAPAWSQFIFHSTGHNEDLGEGATFIRDFQVNSCLFALSFLGILMTRDRLSAFYTKGYIFCESVLEKRRGVSSNPVDKY